MAVGIALVATREGVGVFWILGGWFLATTAVQTGRREELVQTFGGQTAGDIMRSVTEAIPGSMAVNRMVDLYLMGPDLRTYPAEVDGRIVGLIGQPELDAVAPSRWHALSVQRIMTSIGPDDVVDVDEPLENLLLRPSGRTGRVVVVSDGIVVGVIDGGDLAEAISSA